MAQRRYWSGERGKGVGLAWLRAHVGHTGADCLTWPLSRDTRGYGAVCFDGKRHKAHRFMCELVKGPPPSPKHEAAHSCGNGHLGCVNPRHVSWKTRTENAADAMRHGTLRYGKGRKSRKLTAEQAQEIMALKGTKSQREIAAMFGVSDKQVSKIHLGQQWAGGVYRKGGWAPGDPRNPAKRAASR